LDGDFGAHPSIPRPRPVLPEISVATVCNTLNEPIDMGQVLEISVGNDASR